MFVDEAEIHVRAGRGGDGCVSFRREKFVPKGGPDGGDGGDGGGVYAEALHDADTLMDFVGHHHWIAGNGLPGMGKDRSGRKGEDIVLQVPVGTLIFDRETGVLLKDLTEPGMRVCLALPGKGGRGNARFARPDHQTPRESEPGTPGEERALRLELKLIADVGIVGMPNAGKSTLLSRVSRAHPKIADYPFTTLKPQLGIVELSGGRRFVVADIPGLIEGAHEGTGLGDEFLRHIERTRTILHLIDVGSDHTGTTPAEAYRIIRGELAKYSAALAAKPEVVVANKLDLTGGSEARRRLEDEINQASCAISAATGEGLEHLLERLWLMVRQEPAHPPQALAPDVLPPHRRFAETEG